LIARIVCSVVGHRRSRSSAHRVAGEWRSWCKRCGSKLVRVKRSKWLPVNSAPPGGLLGARVEERGDVTRVRLADLEVRHRRAGRHMLRIADPALHIFGFVREMAADDHAQRDAVERRADHSRRVANIPERMAAAAAVLDEQRLAAAWVAAGGDRRVHPHSIALFGIFVDDTDDGHGEEQRREQAEEGLSG